MFAYHELFYGTSAPFLNLLFQFTLWYKFYIFVGRKNIWMIDFLGFCSSENRKCIFSFVFLHTIFSLAGCEDFVTHCFFENHGVEEKSDANMI